MRTIIAAWILSSVAVLLIVASWVIGRMSALDEARLDEE